MTLSFSPPTKLRIMAVAKKTDRWYSKHYGEWFDILPEKEVKKSHQKPKREIELISEAVSKNEWCKSRNTKLSTFGERYFDGRVYYSIFQDSRDGSRKSYAMTIQRIRDWAERNKVI